VAEVLEHPETPRHLGLVLEGVAVQGFMVLELRGYLSQAIRTEVLQGVAGLEY
jgi:hypothetical protein